MFGDKIKMFEDCLFGGSYKLLQQIGTTVFIEYGTIISPFLSSSNISAQKDELALAKPQDGILFGSFRSHGAFATGIGKHITRLLLGSFEKGISRR